MPLSLTHSIHVGCALCFTSLQECSHVPECSEITRWVVSDCSCFSFKKDEILKFRRGSDERSLYFYISLYFFFFGGSKNAKTLRIHTRWCVSKWNSLREPRQVSADQQWHKKHISQTVRVNEWIMKPLCKTRSAHLTAERHLYVLTVRLRT